MAEAEDTTTDRTREDDTAAAPDDGATTGQKLGSRILLTWIELTVVGITGGILGATIGGPPGFIVYLATTLATVAIIFYNVNELVSARLRARENQ